MDPRLERAIQNGPVAMTLHGVAEGYPLVATTPRVEDLLGVDGKTLESSPGGWISFVHPEDEGKVLRGLADISRVRAGTITFRFVRPSGEVRRISASARVTHEEAGQAVELACSLQDVTERVEYHRALREQMEALRRSNVELEQFAHIASHDLSEPLRMVASYTRLIADRYASQLDDDARDFIGFAVGGAERMQAMIRDLLTYSRLSKAEPALEPLEIGRVVDTVESVLRGTIEESGAQIHRDEPLPIVMGAEAQCLTVLQNLVANAIKFRQEGQTPEIHIGASREGDHWRITVADNGIGIEAKSHERVFEAFKKLHRPEQYPGTGLGLSLCRRIVDHHGGSMGLDSDPGVGTTVWFTLPAPSGEEDDTGVFGAHTQTRPAVAVPR